MSRKQKKKDAREQSTRQLMGIDVITDYGIATRMGELVFFAIKPTNISVLPDAGVGATIYALLNYSVKGILFYQGCSNVGDPDGQYTKRLADLVAQWRREIGRASCRERV